MKKNLMIIAICLAGLVYSTASYAQKTELLPDQNPRYQQSRTKYIELADSLTKMQGTTVQQTYKAYDWYQAREEKRAARRERNAALGWSSPYYGNPFFYPTMGYSIGVGFGHRYGWGNLGYGNSWGRGRYWSRW